MLRQIGVAVAPRHFRKLHDVKAALPDVDVVIVDIGALLLHLGAVRFCYNDAAVVGQVKKRVVVAVHKPHIPHTIGVWERTYAYNIDRLLAHLS